MREQLVEVFNRLADEDVGPPGRRRRFRRWGWVSPQLVVATIALALLTAPLAVSATGDVLREGIRNGTTVKETEIIGKFNAGIGAKGGYVTRQSNTQTGAKAGGGAIYGCRGAAGGTAAGSAPCLRASNLADGLAFEFSSNSGPAGLFEVDSPGDAPFATNGGGLVTNLNADKVDGLDAADLKGATGAAGPAGPAGDTGATGPRGPSGGVRRFDGDEISNVSTRTAIKTIDLPAGSWIVNATVTADSDAATVEFASCSLLIGGDSVDHTVATLGPSGGVGEFQSLALTGGDTLGAAGTAVLECNSGDPTIDFAYPSLTAIQVETLETQ